MENAFSYSQNVPFFVCCKGGNQQYERLARLYAESSSTSKLTEWVVENLDSDASTASDTQCGEGDTLPPGGLVIADKVHVLPVNSKVEPRGDIVPIRLLLSGKNGGWGTGVHPTTVLCLEWLGDIIVGGESILDYGCGSGILSIASLGFGAATSVGVDVEAEALVTSEKNLELNG